MTDSVKAAAELGQPNGPAPWVYIIALLPPILLCALVGLQPYIDPADLFRDPLSVAHDAAAKGECCHIYYGFISLLGDLIWVAGAFIALFAATVLYNRGGATVDLRFMGIAGALTLMLVVDDMFQGHDFVYPTLFGIPETVTVAIYACLIVAYLWSFRRQIIEVGPGLLIISLLVFAISVAADLFVPDSVAWHRLTEDGAKLLGIFCWTVFHWWAGWVLLTKNPAS